MNHSYQQYDIHAVQILGCERCLLVGYVTVGQELLEDYEQLYIESLKELF